VGDASRRGIIEKKIRLFLDSAVCGRGWFCSGFYHLHSTWRSPSYPFDIEVMVKKNPTTQK